ncbi:Na+/H+ antiporter NhaC family protein [Halobacillus sp. ACCC02827]|uniref:Na+/H+ antiporter NhaC family protein n=1 Tax=Bacillaceae TaxID=186817 RepID=UPI0002A50159|nr:MULTISPECIES: Na+/H+ antiporter NhaC family protein [Bacillaceae]ELK44638.1 Na+/H+ antiporter NhaC [Halobacillus sp. BAB-2008]QHT45688.1 Na+/H+ antiporter NhaC family protein [Bacillus sp. SB49]WJE16488.1 Na+/H+ antiporter NhaC family protein [Halobacillus sp. ACCC02827]
MTKPKANIFALIPFVVFIVLFIGSGIVTGDFYKMPVLVALFAAILVALLMDRKTDFETKIMTLSKGGGHPNIILMVVIFLLAGAFASVAQGMGAVDSTVNLGLSYLPGGWMVVGLFVIGCFISISMGTSTGTVVALAPIGLGVAEQTDIGVALIMGAIVSGAMFGDNLSIISDTTIAAVRTQGTEMKEKFKANFFIVLPAAIVTAVIFAVWTASASADLGETYSYNFLEVIPYLGVLLFAILGVNVIFVLIGGTVAAGIVGLILGKFSGMELINLIGDGFANMQELSMIAILLGGLVELIRYNGGIEYLLEAVNKRVRSNRGGEFGIAGIVTAINLSTANNTISIITAGPLAKQISDDYGIEPRRSASLLDIFASSVQGIIPYGAQLLAVAGVASISPIAIVPFCIYPILTAVSGILAIVFKFPKFTVQKADPSAQKGS